MSARLSRPQQDLLAEIRESDTGGLWIRDYSRWSRTIRVLRERGLVMVTERFANQAFYEPTPLTEVER